MQSHVLLISSIEHPIKDFEGLIYGPRREKTCLPELVNNKNVDQPAHWRSLISAFVIRLLERFISSIATSEFSNF